MKKITLIHPIQVGKTEISSLNFREYSTAGDYLAFDLRGGVSQSIALISSFSGTDEEVVKKLRGPDFKRAQKIVDDLLASDEKEAGEADAREKKSPES